MIDRFHIAAGGHAGDPADGRRKRLDDASDQARSQRFADRRLADGSSPPDRVRKGVDRHAHGEHGNGEWQH